MPRPGVDPSHLDLPTSETLYMAGVREDPYYAAAFALRASEAASFCLRSSLPIFDVGPGAPDLILDSGVAVTRSFAGRPADGMVSPVEGFRTGVPFLTAGDTAKANLTYDPTLTVLPSANSSAMMSKKRSSTSLTSFLWMSISSATSLTRNGNLTSSGMLPPG